MTLITKNLFYRCLSIIKSRSIRLAVGGVCGIFLSPLTASAQDMALKTNALGWATLSPNVSFEYRVAPKWTLDLSLSYNPFTFNDNKKWRHISVQPEARYWICAPFGGHFVGPHLLCMHYNASNVHLPFGICEQFERDPFQGNL